jgi:WD40 repeat protein
MTIDNHIRPLSRIIQGTCVKTLEGHTGSVCSLALAPDGTLYSASCDNTVKKFST